MNTKDENNQNTRNEQREMDKKARATTDCIDNYTRLFSLRSIFQHFNVLIWILFLSGFFIFVFSLFCGCCCFSLLRSNCFWCVYCRYVSFSLLKCSSSVLLLLFFFLILQSLVRAFQLHHSWQFSRVVYGLKTC